MGACCKVIVLWSNNWKLALGAGQGLFRCTQVLMSERLILSNSVTLTKVSTLRKSPVAAV